MELTAAEMEAIVSNAIEKAIEKAMAKKHIECACGLSDEEQHRLAHFMGVIKHIGGEGQDGYAKGIETFRENSRFVMKWRTACEKTGSIVLCAILAGIIGIAATIGGAGWWAWIKRGGEVIAPK